ncbi:MAG: carboxypeptidase-like regulatory domain-containing protein [Flavobacteriales bacterium]|nr:carboxypeptidase-like regulatory domain-containing protein [Flavobacteriales bacterium]MCX7648951.1 carboxypeptidase-like regulatory domain-containing protein [Flavobacteriales bacterium]MDW8432582.1 carboxypeptidase-like regulatory domain-containing protein [Flavobacteriales bacterium]
MVPAGFTSGMLPVGWIVLSSSITVQAQETTPPERRVVQFSGLVQNEKGEALPFTNISIKNSSRGTTSDVNGFFTLVLRERDTVIFSSVGYKISAAVIPSDIPNQRYYLTKTLIRDTVYLRKATVGPFSKEQFDEAFLNLRLKDDDYERALRNLQQQEMERVRQGTPIDAGVAYKNYMAEQYRQYYYAGGLPPLNILNPFAWYQFIDALKKGKFKDPSKTSRKK